MRRSLDAGSNRQIGFGGRSTGQVRPRRFCEGRRRLAGRPAIATEAAKWAIPSSLLIVTLCSAGLNCGTIVLLFHFERSKKHSLQEKVPNILTRFLQSSLQYNTSYQFYFHTTFQIQAEVKCKLNWIYKTSYFIGLEGVCVACLL
jgi:hypothetical protein